MASVPSRLPSNKVISKVSYPQGLSFRPNSSRYLFLTISLQLQVISFQKQIFQRLSLGAKERRFGADLCQKYEDLIQKYLVQKVRRSFTKNRRMARPILSFCYFCFFDKLSILVCLT
ncbi:hypothetical protein MTR_1g057770 [Medicago truncatula]|uniref:Uncharacterized protein n=1 Tax=Medicago truncatula TaxID=3880 RepID=A0A072VV28_MEDTR|nr:hypothetical protein MTR_1g057770 [Medicago truncatula]